jgi:hypothetical protein
MPRRDSRFLSFAPWSLGLAASIAAITVMALAASSSTSASGTDLSAPCDAWLSILGEAGLPGDGFGGEVAIGDFDGDGDTEVAVSAPFADASAGRVYVFLGPVDTGTGGGDGRGVIPVEWIVPRATLVASPGVSIGGSLAAGDVNGDGIDDIITTNLAGTYAYVVFGGPSLIGEIVVGAGGEDITITPEVGPGSGEFRVNTGDQRGLN